MSTAIHSDDTHFQPIFDKVDVSLWVQDFSRLKTRLEELRSKGVSDIRSYFRHKPDELEATISSVLVNDVNAYTVELFEAGDKQKLLGPLGTVFVPETTPVFLAEIEALWNGQRRFESEAALQTLKGNRLDVMLTISWDADGRQGIVSILDISRQKQSERRIAELNEITKIIAGDLPIETIVQVITDRATALAGAKFGAFFYNVTDHEGERLTLYTLSGAPREAFERFGVPRNTAIFEPTFRGTGTLRSDDIRKDPRYGKNSPYFGMPKGHLPVVSYLAVPVVSKSGEVHGGLYFGHPEKAVFSEETEALVKGIAAHAAIAIDNANLVQRLRIELEQRKEAELVSSRLAPIVEYSDDAIVAKDLQGNIASWNAGAERIFGYSAEEVVGKHITLLFPPELVDQEKMILERIRRGERVEHFETVRRRKDGSLIDISLTISPVKDAIGAIVGASKIARDITARKATESALAQRVEEQAALYTLTDRLFHGASLDEAYESALDAITTSLRCEKASILLFDETGSMKFVAWRGLSDDYRKVAEGHSPWTPDATDPTPVFIEDADKADLDDALRDAVAREGVGALAFIPLISEKQLIGKFMAYYSRPHTMSAGEVSLAVTIARQLGFAITRQRVEEELRLNREQERQRAAELQAIMDSVPAVIWIARDAECSVIEGNKTAHDLLRAPQKANLSLSAPIGERPENFEVFAAGKPVNEASLPVQRAARGEEIRGFEEQVRFSDGTSRFLLGNATPLWADDGQPRGAVAAFVDITERRQAEEERETLVAELSHRVKNTLATVLSVARQTFAHHDDLEAAYRSFESRIRGLAQVHGRLSEQNWSGILLETILSDELSPYANEDGTNISTRGPPLVTPPKIALALEMVFHELATNAAKYGALSVPAGRVHVNWAVDGETVTIDWKEIDGPPVSPPRSTGFGHVLLDRILANDLGGEINTHFREEGLRCEVRFPLQGSRLQ